MSLEVLWSSSALRAADRLDPPIRRRIAAALDRYAETEHGDVVRLTDVRPPQLRLRVGEWRVQVVHRGKAYR